MASPASCADLDVGPGLQDAREACAAVGVRGWHGAQAVERTAELAYLDAGLRVLSDTVNDGRAYFRDRSTVTALGAAAATELAGAAP